MQLPEAFRRLNKVCAAINQSYGELYTAYAQNIRRNDTGFQGMPPQLLQACLINAKLTNRPIRKVIDLGCGNGAFALMAAALGWDAYGIDASLDLVAEACRLRDVLRGQGLIDAGVVCEFASGSIYPSGWQGEYEDFVSRAAKNDVTMPLEMATDAYERLGVDLACADLIYAFTWSDQMPFLCRFLQAQAGREAVFLLPHYRGVEGQFDEDLKLEPLPASLPSALFLGVRAESRAA